MGCLGKIAFGVTTVYCKTLVISSTLEYLCLTHDFARVKFGVKMDVIIHINLPLELLYLLKV